jgi:hypothetical protein
MYFGTQRPPRLSGLGDTSTTPVQIDTADVLNLGDQLRGAQTRLTNIVAQMRSDPSLAQAIGPSVTAQQAALGDLISKYVGVYNGIFGQNPVGLGNPILIAAAVAVILTYVAAQLYLWHQKQDVLEQQAQAQILAEQNRSSMITAANQAQASANAKAAAGDAAGAAQDQATATTIFSQLGVPGSGPVPPPPPGGQSFSDWIKANWLLVAGVGAAVFIVPRLAGR